jgi:hypothetical protein
MSNDELMEQVLKLQADLGGLSKLFAIQQKALELLGKLVDAHQRVFEAQAGYQPPPPGDPRSN